MQAPRPPTAFNILERAGAEARETLRRMSRTEARNIRSFFQTDERNFHYLDIVGHGANSVAVRVKLRSRWYSSHHSEIFVVKRAIVAGVQRKLRNENRILRMLRGAKHIIQLYRTFSSIRNPIDRARGRTVMMEWAPNGTLGNFIRRLARSRDHQSNRMLHMLFMCLVRMCIAMAYPPRQGRRARPRREAFPGSRAAQERKTQLIHYDMHTNNILFGDVERPGDNDHYVLPPLKLIDFEDAEVLSGQHRHNQAVQSNILSIGMIMRCIITGSTNMNAHAVPVRTNVSGLDVTITSFANFPSNLYPDIDDALKSLVVQCCAVNPQERPSLEHLYERAHSHLHNRQYDFYRDTPSAPYERTPWIRRLVQEYILDADN
ncbi:kinase-like domain-containing protein [Daldinia decipiens]|uniref:kinase-like domain-containing protein n=1 Tax=Daldinia decipiens TaxID=326647 RepID=UPI0020C5A9B8|nr:kinase-like domain-containing protein [Daldinia decipiens]KAI1659715.1 kinase-like domain-containing protein [Daldinia decipiens]